MSTNFENLMGALRRELEQYGQMLALLDRQHEQIAQRRADEVSQSVAPIKLCGQAMQQARKHRDECRAQFAQSLQQPKDSTFAQLMPLLPANDQAVVQALVKENNELLARVRQRARQNHLRLSRSIEMMQGLINAIFPSREPRLYNGRGGMKVRRPAQRLFYEAVG